MYTPNATPQTLHPRSYTPNATPQTPHPNFYTPSPEQGADLFDFGAEALTALNFTMCTTQMLHPKRYTSILQLKSYIPYPKSHTPPTPEQGADLFDFGAEALTALDSAMSDSDRTISINAHSCIDGRRRTVKPAQSTILHSQQSCTVNNPAQSCTVNNPAQSTILHSQNLHSQNCTVNKPARANLHIQQSCTVKTCTVKPAQSNLHNQQSCTVKTCTINKPAQSNLYSQTYTPFSQQSAI